MGQVAAQECQRDEGQRSTAAALAAAESEHERIGRAWARERSALLGDIEALRSERVERDEPVPVVSERAQKEALEAEAQKEALEGLLDANARLSADLARARTCRAADEAALSAMQLAHDKLAAELRDARAEGAAAAEASVHLLNQH